MLREVIITKDGSPTISVAEMNVTYHSHHGAMQESMHVYIDAGLRYVLNTTTVPVINIVEMGFGTGLNALLTLIEAGKEQRKVHYTAIELFPLKQEEIILLDYCLQLQREDLKPLFEQLHQCEWEIDTAITSFFTIKKIRTGFADLSTDQQFELIYYDAFAPSIQPQLWTKEIFESLYAMLVADGTLVTYSSKADVRRAMQAAGFAVKKIAGPWGKREMVRARKASGK
jgi:tRNA U34 5-methylaminomethyl-2-thiouridine-forming methyltransferase MnmC